MGPFLLTTPAQHGAEDPTVERSERRLRRRLDELPLMNPAATLQALLEGLQPLNAQRMEHRERLPLLELYRAPVHRVFGTLDRSQLARFATGTERRDALVADMETMCLALAGGYKLVLRDALAVGGQRARDEALLVTALHRAMEQLVLALLHAYRYYRPAPPFLMMELHQLYRMARERSLQERAPTPVAGEVPQPLATVYRQVLLLSLTDPYHQGEGEVTRVFQTLAEHAGKCALEPGAAWPESPEGLFLVDLASDSPPRPCVKLTAPVDADQPFLLDARPALAALHRRVAAMAADQRRTSAEVRILRELLPPAPDAERRTEERRSSVRTVVLVAGIEAVYGHLLDRLVNPAAGAETADTPWTVVDESPKGLRLGRAVGSTDLQVGMPVLVLETGRDPMLAVVRWMREGRDRRFELGVEREPGVPGAVLCRDRGAGTDAMHKCLFLPSVNEADMAATLLTPKALYRPGRELQVHVGGKEIAVKAGRLVAESPVYGRFEFAAVG